MLSDVPTKNVVGVRCNPSYDLNTSDIGTAPEYNLSIYLSEAIGIY